MKVTMAASKAYPSLVLGALCPERQDLDDASLFLARPLQQLDVLTHPQLLLSLSIQKQCWLAANLVLIDKMPQ